MTPEAAAAPARSLRQRQRERVRADILDAVVEVFGRDKTSGAVIEQVAAAAGLSRATLYAYFPGGIDELVNAAYERVGHQFVTATEERMRGRRAWDERILVHAEVMAGWSADHSRAAFYSLVGPRLVTSARAAGIGSGSTRRTVAVELARAQQAGEVAPSVDREATASLLTGCVRVIGIEGAIDAARASQYLEAFVTLLSGLRVR